MTAFLSLPLLKPDMDVRRALLELSGCDTEAGTVAGGGGGGAGAGGAAGGGGGGAGGAAGGPVEELDALWFADGSDNRLPADVVPLLLRDWSIRYTITIHHNTLPSQYATITIRYHHNTLPSQYAT